MLKLWPYVGIALAVAVGIALAPYVWWIAGTALVAGSIGGVLRFGWTGRDFSSSRAQIVAGVVSLVLLVGFARGSHLALNAAFALLGALCLWASARIGAVVWERHRRTLALIGWATALAAFIFAWPAFILLNDGSVPDAVFAFSIMCVLGGWRWIKRPLGALWSRFMNAGSLPPDM